MSWVRDAIDSFWSESVWLPPNTTWKDIAPGADPNINHANYRHLYYPIPMGLVMLLLRYLLEKFWFSPVGVTLGIKKTRLAKVSPNPTLERAYFSAKTRIKYKQVQELSKELGWPERRIEKWLWQRRNQDKPSTLTKFCENSWRCLYYTCSFFYGLIVLWDKPWLWDINRCWDGYPHQSVTDDVWWYYMISLSFYWSLSISQFFDVRRKDFWQMFVHHIATILLMGLSWTCNLYRIGTLVLVVHDCADIFLEAAKMAKYANYQKVCDVIFAIFTVLWIATRLGVYPFWIIYNTSVEAPLLVAMFPAYYIFNTLLILLLVLHVFWTFLILKIAYKALNSGKMEGDIRSSSSACSEATSHED